MVVQKFLKMYLLSCLLFSTLVVNGLAENIMFEAEQFKQLTKELTPICACTEFKLNKETACLEIHKPISVTVTASCKYLASLVKNKNLTSEIETASNPPKTESSENIPAVNPSKTGSSETKTTTNPSKTGSSENIPATNSSKTGSSETKTTDAAVINAPLGCNCIYITSTAENAKKTLNCSISNESKDFLKTLPETIKAVNSYCQNITYESLTKPDTDKSEYNKKLTEVISIYVCELDQTFCATEDIKNYTVETVKEICARSNVNLGLSTKSKVNETLRIFTALLKKKKIPLGAIDHLCESIKIRYTELYEVAQQNVADINETVNSNQSTTEPTQVDVETKTETTIDNHQTKTETSTVNNQAGNDTASNKNQTSTAKPVVNDNKNTAKNGNTNFALPSPSKYVRTPEEHQSPTEAGKRYSTGTVVGIVFCAIAFGSLIAVAAKISYTRCKRRTYAVNQIRS